MTTTKIARTFDTAKIREEFPILTRLIHGKPLTYLDSTATSQKPERVIEGIDNYYRTFNANVHRGVYVISEEATAAYEQAHSKVASFINAKSAKEIIFTRGTTESINLVAYSWGRKNIHEGDLIILTELEHHSNLVPWQILAEEKGARLEFVPIDAYGILKQDVYLELLAQKPRLVCFTHISNTLGTINPAKEMIAQAKEAGAVVLLDGAQSVPHMPVDVRDLNVDFFAFSGHKMCGPTGIGVLYGRRELLEAMPPFLTGGDMIRTVGLRKSTWNDLPYKFEAGTPAVAEGVGLGIAIDYLKEIGMDNIRAHEEELLSYALARFAELPDVILYGPPLPLRGGIISFNLHGVHPHDVATLLDREGVAVRAGHHCTQPLMECLRIDATTRASFYLYNNTDDVDRLIEAVVKTKKVFKV